MSEGVSPAEGASSTASKREGESEMSCLSPLPPPPCPTSEKTYTWPGGGNFEDSPVPAQGHCSKRLCGASSLGDHPEAGRKKCNVASLANCASKLRLGWGLSFFWFSNRGRMGSPTICQAAWRGFAAVVRSAQMQNGAAQQAVAKPRGKPGAWGQAGVPWWLAQRSLPGPRGCWHR